MVYTALLNDEDKTIIDEDEYLVEQPVKKSGTQFNQDSWNIGMRRVSKIVDQENAQGNQAWATGMYSNLPDVVVFDTNVNSSPSGGQTLVTVYEVTNYGKPTYYISKEKAVRYKNTLKQFNCRKVFVCSYEENLGVVGGRKFFENEGIEVQVIGGQD